MGIGLKECSHRFRVWTARSCLFTKFIALRQREYVSYYEFNALPLFLWFDICVRIVELWTANHAACLMDLCSHCVRVLALVDHFFW